MTKIYPFSSNISKTQNKHPGTQSTFIPKLEKAQEWVISSEVDINLIQTLEGNTIEPVDLNKRK